MSPRKPPRRRTATRGEGDGRVTVSAELDASPTSVRVARDAVTELLVRNGCDDALVESIRLVVSELVTNAVVHAGTDIRLRCRVDTARRRVRIEVTDERPEALPVLRPSERGDGIGGWGLHFVSTMGTNWGVATSDHRKTVWCDVDAARHAGAS
jgi:anti-sigma regulatory factor (Ser/Thr protein kinase)